MSIQTEIDRIEAARDNIAVAIRSKGVTLPPSAKLGDMPGYIRTIPTTASISTCSIHISHLYEPAIKYFACTVVNPKTGMLESYTISTGSYSDLTVDNVACGSVFYVWGNDGYSSWNTSGGVTTLGALSSGTKGYFFVAPTTANATGRIIIDV